MPTRWFSVCLAFLPWRSQLARPQKLPEQLVLHQHQQCSLRPASLKGSNTVRSKMEKVGCGNICTMKKKKTKRVNSIWVVKSKFIQFVKVTAAVVKNSLSQLPVKMFFLAGQPKKRPQWMENCLASPDSLHSSDVDEIFTQYKDLFICVLFYTQGPKKEMFFCFDLHYCRFYINWKVMNASFNGSVKVVIYIYIFCLFHETDLQLAMEGFLQE